MDKALAYWPTTRPIPVNTMLALLVNCAVPTRLDLGDGVWLEPLREGLGFRGEINYFIGLGDQLGVRPPPEDSEFFQQMRQTIQVGAILHLSPVDVQLPKFPGDVQTTRLRTICAVLSALTDSTVDPIVTVLSRGETAEVRLWNPIQPFAILTSDRTAWVERAKTYRERAESDPRFRLLLQLVQTAQQAENHLLSTFHYAQILEIAAGFFGFEAARKQEVSIPVTEFLRFLDIMYRVDDILMWLEIKFEPGKRQDDPIKVLFWIRNRVAHDGEITEERRRKYNHPLTDSDHMLYGLSHQYLRVVQAMLDRLTWEKFRDWNTVNSKS